jgi:hypothetical protein
MPNGKPNSNSVTVEVAWVPFGKDDSWGRPLTNLKLGIQYTIYTMFNDGTNNYDGFGHDASRNNTLFLYAWLAFQNLPVSCRNGVKASCALAPTGFGHVNVDGNRRTSGPRLE